MGASLSAEELKTIARSTNFNVEEIEEKYKEFQEEFPDGKITKEKFQEVYNEYFDHLWGREEFKGDTLWRHVFRACDTNKTGYVDFKELITAIDHAENGTPREKMAWMFRIYDISNSGFLNEREITTVIQSIYELEIKNHPKKAKFKEEVQKRAEKIFDKMDHDGDGKVYFKEFMAACEKDKEIFDFLTNEH